jgi:hypothetical protein
LEGGCVIMVTHMTRRYSTVTATEQRAGAVVFSIIGAGYLSLIAFMVLTDANPPLVRAGVLTIPGWASLAGALYVWRRKTRYLAVDLDARRALFVSNGKASWNKSLDELGGLAIVPIQRTIRRQNSTGTRTEYQVVAGRDGVPIYGRWDYAAAKRFAVRTAREWRVALKPLDGRVRAAGDADRPLASEPAPIGAPAVASPPSVHVTRDNDGVTIRSVNGLGAADAPNVMWLLAAGMATLALSERSTFVAEAGLAGTPFETGLAVVLGLAALGALAKFADEARGWMSSPEIRIDARRVTFRGRSVQTAAVSEVVNAGGIHILGDGRAIEVPPQFGEPRDTTPLIDTLRALIVEYGARAPSRR